MSEIYEPKRYAEAKKDHRWSEWQQATKEQVDSLTQNETWKLTKLPANCRPLRGKWVYRLKWGPTSEIIRYKARWVVGGFEQREGIDYREIFASVVKPMSYKAIFAIAAAQDWVLEQMDVKTAFLYRDVEEDIYVIQPDGLRITRKRGSGLQAKEGALRSKAVTLCMAQYPMNVPQRTRISVPLPTVLLSLTFIWTTFSLQALTSPKSRT